MKRISLSKASLACAGILVVLCSLALALTNARSRARRTTPAIGDARLAYLPKVILWAWERPTDLHFINPRDTGVAFLARTIRLRSGDIIVRPRLQPLDLTEGTKLVAVARIETDPFNRPQLSRRQLEMLTDAIVAMALLPKVSTIQLDFDASKSERGFYRDVILDVRRRLPDNVALSITALASWCTYDDWLSGLPIDEAVPMLFRVGPDGRQLQNRVAAGEEFTAAPCRESYGVSTDEPIQNLSAAKRLYVFSPNPWTEETVRSIIETRK